MIAPPLTCMEEWLTEDTSIIFSPARSNAGESASRPSWSAAEEGESAWRADGYATYVSSLSLGVSSERDNNLAAASAWRKP